MTNNQARAFYPNSFFHIERLVYQGRCQEMLGILSHFRMPRRDTFIRMIPGTKIRSPQSLRSGFNLSPGVRLEVVGSSPEDKRIQH